MRIAVDFDGTLFQWAAYPEIGPPVANAIETCKRLQAAGHELILWTCRDGHGLWLATKKLQEHGLHIIHINTYPDQEYLSNKVDADIFIDDKALGVPLVSEGPRPYVDWFHVEHLLSQQGLLVVQLSAPQEFTAQEDLGPDPENFCGMCKHSLKDNSHGFDQNDAYMDESLNVIHFGTCTYCSVCNPRLYK